MSDFAGSGRKAHNFFLSLASGLTPIVPDDSGTTTIFTSASNASGENNTFMDAKRSTDDADDTSTTKPITLETFLEFPSMPFLETDEDEQKH